MVSKVRWLEGLVSFGSAFLVRSDRISHLQLRLPKFTVISLASPLLQMFSH